MIREIRNACAHSRQPISFATHELKAALQLVGLEVEAAAPKEQSIFGKFMLAFHANYLLNRLKGMPEKEAAQWQIDYMLHNFPEASLEISRTQSSQESP